MSSNNNDMFRFYYDLYRRKTMKIEIPILWIEVENKMRVIDSEGMLADFEEKLSFYTKGVKILNKESEK